MGKILSYGNLGGAAASGDALFIGDISTSPTNPEIKFIVTNDLFKRSNIWAADGNGLSLYDDSSTLGVFIKDGGHVGVGTSSPTSPLHVYETAANSILKLETSADSYDSYIDFIQAGTSKFNVGFDDTNDQLVITRAIGSNNDIVVASNGNVGIGTTTKSSTLNVLTDLRIDSTADIIIDASKKEIRVDDGDLKLMEYGGGTSSNKSTGGVEIFGNGGSSPLFYAKVASTTDDSQNLIGIGTSSPSAKLHVKDVAANVLRLETTTNTNPYIQITGRSGGTPFETYLSSSTSLIGIGSASTAGSTTLNIGRATGSEGHVHIGGTGMTYKFAVTGTAPTISSLTSSSSLGTLLRIRNTHSTLGSGARSVTAYTINNGTNQIVNWINGYFKNGSDSYFGAHYKNVAVSGDSDINFDSTLNNNLFYINTSGTANLGGAIHTHNIVTTGHNTGRFVQAYHLRVYLNDNQSQLFGGFGQPMKTGGYTYLGTYNAQTTTTVANASATSIAPFGGKLIKAFISGGNIGGTLDSSLAQTKLFFNVTASGGTLPANNSENRLTSTNSADVTFAAETITANTPLTIEESGTYEWDTSTGGTLEFDEKSLVMLAIESVQQSNIGVANITLIYEFKVT